jgi:hypothetical protein
MTKDVVDEGHGKSGVAAGLRGSRRARRTSVESKSDSWSSPWASVREQGDAHGAMWWEFSVLKKVKHMVCLVNCC